MVVSGFVIRLLLAPYTGEADLSTYAESSTTMAYGGGPYTYLIVYPPGWVFLLDLIGHATATLISIQSFLSVPSPIFALRIDIYILQPTSITNPVFSLSEKIPLFVFDFLLALLLYEIALESGASKTAARWAFIAYFLNPLVIFMSAVHGAYDVIPEMLVVASFYLALRGRGLTSGIALGLGVITKVFPIFFLPLLVAVLWRHRGVDESRGIVLRRYAAWAAGVVGMAALVFWPSGLLQGYSGLITVGPTLGENHGGFGIWSWVQIPTFGAVQWELYWNTGLVMVLTTISAVLLAIVVALAYLRRSRTGKTDREWLLAFVATSFVSLIAFAAVQPQYLLWVLPGMIIVAAVERRFRSSIVIVTAAGVIFYLFGLSSPLLFLQPLATYTTLLSWSTITNSILASLDRVGWIALVSSILGSVILAWVAIRASFRVNPLRPSEQ